MRDITQILSASQKRLLDLIQKVGEVTVAEAVDHLDLATTTIRQHVATLEDHELVDRREQADGRGRPTAYYSLSERGRQLYPSNDGEVLSELLEFLGREGYHRAIDDFFHEYWEGRRKDLQKRLEEADAGSFEDELEVLREFLADQGFMPEVDVRDDGTVVIRECNCPLRGSVRATKLPCRLEAEFLEKVVGRTLTRVEYIPEGNPACTYEFELDQ